MRFSTFGVDTVAVGFEGIHDEAYRDAFDRSDSLSAGRGRLLTRTHDSGARIVWYPAHSLVKVECRLSAMAEGTRHSHRLGTRAELVELPRLAADVVQVVAGIPADELAELPSLVRRLDVTGELRFDEASDGLSFLRAAAGLVPPGYKGEAIVDRAGQVETAYTITTQRGRRVARFYDSGLKHRSAAAGELVRYEVETRWPKARAYRAAELGGPPQVLPLIYSKHLAPFTEYAEGITVTIATNAPAQISRLLAQGVITKRQATGLAGFAAMLPHGGRHLVGDRTSRRYLRELRRYGVVLGASEQDAAVTLGEGLRRLLDGAADASGVGVTGA